MASSKAELLKGRGDANQREITLPSGATVVVRGLTRAQALGVDGEEMDALEVERRLLAMALADPTMTEDEVGEWQSVVAAGELAPVVDAVLELSGMTTEAPNRAARRFRK
jgi:hypothetical protein